MKQFAQGFTGWQYLPLQVPSSWIWMLENILVPLVHHLNTTLHLMKSNCMYWGHLPFAPKEIKKDLQLHNVTQASIQFEQCLTTLTNWFIMNILIGSVNNQNLYYHPLRIYRQN